MISATVNEPVPLQVYASDGRQDLFGVIYVYDPQGNRVATLTANHLVDGIYSATWTPDTEGYYTYSADLFFDPAYLTNAGYERKADLIEVTATKTHILRLLGLSHENSVIDQQTYGAEGQLTGARIRVYASRANAVVAGTQGLRFSYTVQAVYEGAELVSYKILRDL